MLSRTREEEESKPPSQVRRLLNQFFEAFKDDFFVIVGTAVFALVRAMGVTIQSGQTGLRFSFGRAGKELSPGFYPLIPFLQSVRKIPTRSRTMDLPAQRVATFEGLVYHVDASIVYRIDDVRKALIEIDDVELGMLQMLGLGVQDVVRAASRADILHQDGLSSQLAANLARRLEPWGVVIERAGFPSITPSPKTLRITQLERVIDERKRMLDRLEDLGLDRTRAVALMGTRVRALPRGRHLRIHARHTRRIRHLRTKLLQRGWLAVQVSQAGRRLRSRIGPNGRLRTRAKQTDKQRAKAK